MNEPTKHERCRQCEHDFDPHAVVATTDDPRGGGIILCPEPGCLCYSTWGVILAAGDSSLPNYIPPEEEIAVIRESIQEDAAAARAGG